MSAGQAFLAISARILSETEAGSVCLIRGFGEVGGTGSFVQGAPSFGSPVPQLPRMRPEWSHQARKCSLASGQFFFQSAFISILPLVFIIAVNP